MYIRKIKLTIVEMVSLALADGIFSILGVVVVVRIVQKATY